jgi:hypothetical protein
MKLINFLDENLGRNCDDCVFEDMRSVPFLIYFSYVCYHGQTHSGQEQQAFRTHVGHTLMHNHRALTHFEIQYISKLQFENFRPATV